MMAGMGNNRLVREPVLIERVGQVCARLEKLANKIEAAGGVPGDANAASWLRHTITMVRKIQKEKTEHAHRAGCLASKQQVRLRVMRAYRTRMRDLQARINELQSACGRKPYVRGGDRDLRAVGSIIKAGDPITMAQQIAEAITGTAYVYRTATGACVIRRQATATEKGELVGVYDEGADWRDIAGDLTA